MVDAASSEYPVTRTETDGSTRLISENFLTAIVNRDLKEGKVKRIVTRFPPEPNGYPHIGHAFASYINFGLAQDFGGLTRLRMDDTNPETERLEYVEGFIRDMTWLGWQWDGEVSFASNYFDELYAMAVRLIRMNKAYVDSSDNAEIKRLRGSATTPGTPSPYRERGVEENLDLLERMRAGEFKNGEHVLRAKIDMSNPNMKLRDPILYRIVNATHYRTGDTWHIYPSYDFAQAPSDALDGVTHSLCSLEFTDNRAIYDWLMDNLWENHNARPHQYEFGRRSLEYTVVSKRKLIQLIDLGVVTGWDDPRMPTLAGLRRRGVRPEAIRDFVGRIGVSRTNRTVDIALLEYAIRSDLNPISPRVMAVLEPVRVTLTNYPEGQTEMLDAPYWPHDIPQEGSRDLPFGRTLYIERSDFQETPERGFRRLSPGASVRLRHAYVIRCDEVVKDNTGSIVELRCTYLTDTLGEAQVGDVRGVIHWVEAKSAVQTEFRLYDRLFKVPDPEADDTPFTDKLNPDSLVTVHGLVEASVQHDAADTRYQFERQGYFYRDLNSQVDAPVFNRIITLRDTWESATETRPSDARRAPRRAAPAPQPEPVRDVTSAFSTDEFARFEALVTQGVSHEEAAVIVKDAALSDFFAAAATSDNSAQLGSWVVGEVARSRRTNGSFAVAPGAVAELIALIGDGTLSARLAKEVFAEMVETGGAAGDVVARRGLEQVSDVSALAPIVETLIAQNPDKAEAYRSGKTGLLGFFVGQLMKETKGQANPQLAQDLIKKKLG